MHRILLTVLAVAAVGCQSAEPVLDPGTGLEILDALPPFPGSGGATEWQTPPNVPDGVNAATTTHADLASLVAAFASTFPGEASGMHLAMGLLGPPTDDAATLVGHVTRADDSTVVGDEFVLDLRHNERGWYIERVHFRFHCRHAPDAEVEASCS
jgi:hypothetical protein